MDDGGGFVALLEALSVQMRVLVWEMVLYWKQRWLVLLWLELVRVLRQLVLLLVLVLLLLILVPLMDRVLVVLGVLWHGLVGKRRCLLHVPMRFVVQLMRAAISGYLLATLHVGEAGVK
jgi:hypothetical protein